MADDGLASPAVLSEIEDADLWDDEDEDVGRGPDGANGGGTAQRKRRAASQGSRDDVVPGLDPASPARGPGGMLDGARGSLYYSGDDLGDLVDGGHERSGYGGSMYGPGPTAWSSGYGSWYFQPGSQGGPTGGSGPGAAPGGGGLAPHLASYWGIAEEAQRGPSDYTERSDTAGAETLEGQRFDEDDEDDEGGFPHEEEEYQVYSTRWIMLGYMSVLNLLSDWTCYSVAPIAILTADAFGEVDPEALVTVFLGANAVASAMEPMILGRLGLRRTVLFGALLLMIGSIIKSGGFMSLAGASPLSPGDEGITWRLYAGFFLVGLSQPLYQCTPALLSASWFPENERTMATGVALNSNQLGIGFAFVFGTVLVDTQEDIIPYFGILSMVATIAFIGTALHFDDAPPTPPSDTARVIKGDLVIKLPFLGRFGPGAAKSAANLAVMAPHTPTPPADATPTSDNRKGLDLDGLLAPSNASTDGPVERDLESIREEEELLRSRQAQQQHWDSHKRQKSGRGGPHPQQVRAQPGHPLQQQQQPPPPMMMMPPPPGYYPQYPPESPGAAGMQYSPGITPQFYHGYDGDGHYRNALLDAPGMYDAGHVYDDLHGDDEGAEPILTQLDHQLDIDIRDDQIVQQFRACFRRPGFAHCVVAFTTSGIVINTLSTFMDYLVTLNGAGREYVGYVGGTFQALIMVSSLAFGGWTDHSRKYCEFLCVCLKDTFGRTVFLVLRLMWLTREHFVVSGMKSPPTSIFSPQTLSSCSC